MEYKINVLGTEYVIREETEYQNHLLKKCDGYCDKTSKTICVLERSEDSDLAFYEDYKKKVKRHEIIHAFLFESGLHENWTHENGHDETFIDWIAVQFPKLKKAFEEADAL